MAKPLNILFVCTGNTCRSAMAKGLLEKMWPELAAKNVEIAVSSAGVNAFEGLPASWEALAILKEEGIDLGRHRSRKVTAELVRKADYIFAMARGHRDFLVQLFPEAGEKIWLFLEFAGKKAQDVSDPYARGMQDYRLVAGEIKAALQEIIAILNNAAGAETPRPS